MNEVRLDPRDKKIMPCTECLSVVQETLQDYDKEAKINSIESSLSEYDEEIEVGFGRWGTPSFMKR
jgi:hypothetical protein